jgi:hypothetical protein
MSLHVAIVAIDQWGGMFTPLSRPGKSLLTGGYI